MSPAKHSSAGVTDRQTDRRTDRRTDGRTTDKVIPMCRYASQATQKPLKTKKKPQQQHKENLKSKENVLIEIKGE